MSSKIQEWADRSPFGPNRFLEILPGAIAWFLILFPFWGAFVFPSFVAYGIIAFDIFWFYKSATGGVAVLASYLKMKRDKEINWLEKTQALPGWDTVRHIVIIPFANEPLYILERTLESLEKQTLPNQQLFVVLAAEERIAGSHQRVKQLERKFSSRITNLYSTFHRLVPGEVVGKSSNEASAAKWAKKKVVDDLGHDISKITATTVDCDGVFHPRFFACLTYKFLTNPQPHHHIWQSAAMFYNNIWQIPSPSRIINTMSSMWNLGLLSRKDRIINFSVYTLSLKLLDQIGYWDVDVIPEDYRMFFKAFFKLKGELEIESIYLPLHYDAAESTTTWRTLKNQYLQQQRWAWGVSDQTLLLRLWWHAKEIPFWHRTIRVVKVFVDHILWPTNWFFLTLGANIPILLNPAFKHTALGANLPRISSLILTFCLAFLIIFVIVDAKCRPPRPKEVTPFYWLLTPLEWLMLPVASFFLSALPGLDAHTRLMLGKYLEYKVTEKV